MALVEVYKHAIERAIERAMRRVLPALVVVSLAVGSVSLGQTPAGGAGGAAPAATNPPPTKLAVVSIVTLFDALDEKADADTRIDQMKKTYENESRKMQQEVEQMQKEVDDPKIFAKGSPEYKKMQDDLLTKATALEVHDKVAQAKLMLELRLVPLDIYRKMSDAIRDYSQANGIALVFVADDTSTLSSARTPQELMSMISLRKVIYFHPTFDVTKAIIDRMNTAYKLGGGKKP